MLGLTEATFLILSSPGSPLSSSAEGVKTARMQEGKRSRFAVDYRWIEVCSAAGKLLN